MKLLIMHFVIYVLGQYASKYVLFQKRSHHCVASIKNYFFRTFLCLRARNNSRIARGIVLKFGIGEL
jgi:hypothetical protein